MAINSNVRKPERLRETETTINVRLPNRATLLMEHNLELFLPRRFHEQFERSVKHLRRRSSSRFRAGRKPLDSKPYGLGAQLTLNDPDECELVLRAVQRVFAYWRLKVVSSFPGTAREETARLNGSNQPRLEELVYACGAVQIKHAYLELDEPVGTLPRMEVETHEEWQQRAHQMLLEERADWFTRWDTTGLTPHAFVFIPEAVCDHAYIMSSYPEWYGGTPEFRKFERKSVWDKIVDLCEAKAEAGKEGGRGLVMHLEINDVRVMARYVNEIILDLSDGSEDSALSKGWEKLHSALNQLT